MIYYHVSSYVCEQQYLTEKTKNNRCFCEYVSNCYATNYNEYKMYFEELCHYKVQEITGRDASKWICEAIFDSVRKTKFSHMPSRVWGVYLMDTFEKACQFRAKYRDINKSRIFEVEAPKEAVFGFDMSIFTSADDKIRKTNFSYESYRQAVDLATLYWSGEVKTEINEFLVDCPVVVGKCVA